jgi:hypothetical protein
MLSIGRPAPVPDALVERFRVPPFLLGIYQAAATRYGVPWEVLAAINEIETDYGRNVRVSSAGAVGWMQFMPSTWARYGVDANRDGVKDPYDPVDAIFAAARYLRAAGAARDLRIAVLAYNHAGWYADSVLRRAQLISATPAGLLDALTGLSDGHVPIAAKWSYGGRSDGRRVELRSLPGAPVAAVSTGRIVKIGWSRRLGRFMILRDAYGDTFTYGNLGRVYRRSASRPGVARGAIVARLRRDPGARSASLRFEIRAPGARAPRIAARAILDGWRVLASLHADRALGSRPASIERIASLSTPALEQRVLSDPRIQIYDCGRQDIRAGRIDRRVLATMLYLDASGLHPTISSLKCGHGYLTSSGNVSEHSTGTAMDIAAINGIVIRPATQGPGSITAVTIARLLALTGAMKPHQIISLMTFPGASNTLALPDHADHIHVGWRPSGEAAPRSAGALAPRQWRRLMDRLDDSPAVSRDAAGRLRVRVKSAPGPATGRAR